MSLDPDILLRGYAIGVFPMADDAHDENVFWVDPRRRAVIPIDDFRPPRSLTKRIAQGRFHVTANRAFARIVDLCAETAPDRPSTWINADIRSGYAALHAIGHAHSIECWSAPPSESGKAELLGGLYGVSLGGAFFGESMVSRATDASKVALAWLIARLRVGGFTLLDCQFMTPHLAALGAQEIARDAYRQRLYCALSGASAVPTDASLPPPAPFAAAEFGALDALLADAAADASAGAASPGKLIAQLLT